MPTLSLRHLTMLDAIAASPTLAEAAQRLSITPSALTHRLQEAERRVARPLLLRSGRRVELSEAGKRLLQAARTCLRELDSAEREVAAGASDFRQTVRLGASTLCGYEWLPGLMARLGAAHPSIEVEVAMDASLDPLSALRSGHIEVAVLPAQIRGRRLASIELFRDEMIALTAESHPIAGRRFVDVRELAAERYVADVTTPETGREYERLFVPAGIRPARVLRAGHMAAVVGLVRAGLGVTICTRTSAAPFVPGGGLSMVRLAPRGVFLTWYALVHARRERSAAARLAAETLAAVVR
jgi:LysR family transcriptional regulator for metE and metH